MNSLITFGASANFTPANDISPMMVQQLFFTAPGYSLSGSAIEFAGSDPDLFVNHVGTTTISNDFTINVPTTIDGLNSIDSVLDYSGTATGTGSLFIQQSTVIVDGSLNNTEIGVSGTAANSELRINGSVGAGIDLGVGGDGTFFGTLSGTGTISRGSGC